MKPDARIVVLAPNWLGDAVMSLAALGDVRETFGAATLAVAARPSTAALFEMVAGVDEVVTLERGRSAATANAEALARGRFDLALLFPNSFGSAWTTARARIPERWGYRADWRTRWLTRAVPRPRGGHQIAYYRDLVRALDIAPACDPLAILVSGGSRDLARERLRSAGWDGVSPLVGVAPGAAYGAAKQWPPEYFAALIADLAARHGATAVLVGTAADARVGDAIARRVRRGASLDPPTAAVTGGAPSDPAGMAVVPGGASSESPAIAVVRRGGSSDPRTVTVPRRGASSSDPPAMGRPEGRPLHTRDEGRTGRDEARTGGDEGRVTRDEARVGADEARARVDTGLTGDDRSGRTSDRRSERRGEGRSREGDPGGVLNLIGQTDLKSLAATLVHCRALVSNDSGAVHLAAALGVPVIAIFGPTRERETAPRRRPGGPEPRILIHDVFCRPCMLRECPIDHRCMRGLDPARAAAACRDLVTP